jgi:SsrA-binding protein
LLKGPEIAEIDRALSRGGYTGVPMRLYFKRGRVKVEIGIAVGKKKYDKRADIAKRDADREARAAVRASQRG